MNQPTTTPIESIMHQGAKVEVTLITGTLLTGAFNGFMPTKDATYFILVTSNLEFTNHLMIPLNQISYFNFPQKLSSLIN
jgi:hypothetical protein